METKVCKVCGTEYPISDFKTTRGGSRASTCNHCVNAKRNETMSARRSMAGGGEMSPFSDPDFDGKNCGDVWRMMCRAKRWLETRGYAISLVGEYREVKIRKLKFE